MVEVRQKISGCLRTHAGARTSAAPRPYLSATGKQHVAALGALRQLADGHPWLPNPQTC